MLCLFGFHKWKSCQGTWRRTGEFELDWSLRLRPQYMRIEKCDRCGKHRKTLWLSYADEPI